MTDEFNVGRTGDGNVELVEDPNRGPGRVYEIDPVIAKRIGIDMVIYSNRIIREGGGDGE